MNRALRAEWTKLRTARGTAMLPFLAAALTVGLGTAISATAAPGTTSCAGGCDPVRISLSGVYLGQMAVVVLAVLVSTGEYHHGLLGTTLAATPRRLTVFAAKAAAVTVAVLPAGLLGVAGSLLAGRILLPGNGFTAAYGYPALSLAGGSVLRAASGTVLYLGLVALLSFGLATALRHTTAAVTTVLGLLYLAPVLAQFVTSEPWHGWIEKYAPMTADLGVLAGYTGAALVLGAVLFISRDAGGW